MAEINVWINLKHDKKSDKVKIVFTSHGTVPH